MGAAQGAEACCCWQAGQVGPRCRLLAGQLGRAALPGLQGAMIVACSRRLVIMLVIMAVGRCGVPEVVYPQGLHESTCCSMLTFVLSCADQVVQLLLRSCGV